MPYKWSAEIPTIKQTNKQTKAHITVMRIKKAVDIHKMCSEISFLFPYQGDTLSYIRGNHSSYDIGISICVTVEFQD